MNQIKHINGKGVPVIGNDIDTDRIIPARFLRCVTFDGLGERAFADDRAQAKGQHPFDLPQYQGATILVVNDNFGCGSSREHAPQALARWGIKAIIGESFAEIFFGNCVAIGLPCVSAERETVKKLQELLLANPQAAMNVNLETMTVSCDRFNSSVTMDEGSKQRLLIGTWDNCGQLTSNIEEIKRTANRLPYLKWQTS